MTTTTTKYNRETVRNKLVTVAGSDWETDTPRKFHSSLSAVTHAPFHVLMQRPASQVGRMSACMHVGLMGRERGGRDIE